MKLYKRTYCTTAKYDAQRALAGRTHYADDETLRFFYARILSTSVSDDGLMFGLVESVALDYNNTRRGYRHAVFDVFGTMLERPDLEGARKTADAARRDLRDAMLRINAKTHTLEAIERNAKRHAADLAELRATVLAIGQQVAA